MKSVLFVCVHNAGRSQMAEAFVNSIAAQSGVEVVGLSAGTITGSAVNPVAVEVMGEVGISMVGQTPKQLTSEMVRSADRVITMGCGVDAEACPANTIFSDDWGLDDPIGQSIDRVREIRDQIRARVEALLGELSA